MKMTKNEEKEKTRILTRNDKIRSSSRGVEKGHWKHQGCYVGRKNLFFQQQITSLKTC
jgi:hypothetical protein